MFSSPPEVPTSSPIAEVRAVKLDPSVYSSTSDDYVMQRMADPEIVDGLMRHLHVREGGRYLDVGCGSGNYSKALYARGLSIEGMDCSEAMLSKAAANAPQIVWTLGDVRALPYGASAFDGISCVNVLHYVQDDFPKVAEELWRVLKPGGRLVIFGGMLDQCLHSWIGHYFPFFWNHAPHWLKTEEAWRSGLEKAGFSSISCERYYAHAGSKDRYSYVAAKNPATLLDPNWQASTTPFNRKEYASAIVEGCVRLSADLATGAWDELAAKFEQGYGEGVWIEATKPAEPLPPSLQRSNFEIVAPRKTLYPPDGAKVASISFISGNSAKQAEIRQFMTLHCPELKVTFANPSIHEIQSLDPVEVAIDKARQAFAQGDGTPVLVDDAGIFFHKFDRFPGVMTKHFIEAVGYSGTFQLMSPEDPCSIYGVLVYMWGPDDYEVFVGRCEGRLVGDAHTTTMPGLPLEPIFVPDGQSLLYAELRAQGCYRFHYRQRALLEWKAWWIGGKAAHESE